jgi:pyruvate/2-oxoglutarate/acetoin dehydrogenase E1 component
MSLIEDVYAQPTANLREQLAELLSCSLLLGPSQKLRTRLGPPLPLRSQFLDMPVYNIIQAVNDALRIEMRKNDRIVVLGEDVGNFGGVFRATSGLQEEFGKDRVMDTPLAEAGIIGTAIGMALYGLRPVAEIQFSDFIFPAFDQIVNELAKFRYRSGGEYPVPMVIRTPYGGGIRGGHYHSQSPEAYFAHTPGLKVVIPSNPYDAKGLLLSAMRDEDPILFLEPKRVYRASAAKFPRVSTPSRSAKPRSCVPVGRDGAVLRLDGAHGDRGRGQVWRRRV